MFSRTSVATPDAHRLECPSAPASMPLEWRDTQFLIAVYFGGLILRLVVGGTILFGGYVEFFGGDHLTYDSLGWALAQAWQGHLQNTHWLLSQTAKLGQNGMYYWVAALYSILGHYEFAAVGVQIAVVSFTPILAYKTVWDIYGSIHSARFAAIAVAFLPSMVIWSSLLLKDPLIVFLLAVTVFCTIRMQKEVRFRYFLPAAIAMLLLFPLRGYVFYFILLAVVGSLLMARFGRRASLTAYFSRLAGLVIIAVALFALGFDRIATEQLDVRILEKVQSSRLDLAKSAQSGFAREANVSTLSGAVSFLPRGVVYLLFAPFPWQGGSLRSMLTVPETLLWYAMFPFCVIGFVYTLRNHLRDALVVFLFVLQLTCFYGIFVGNVGTAYRQRTQVFLFYIMFTSVGWVYTRRRKKGLIGSTQG